MNEELEIEIAADGTVQVTTKGIKGKGCLEYAKVFQQILGEVTERHLTAEYYETPATTGSYVSQKQYRRT